MNFNVNRITANSAYSVAYEATHGLRCMNLTSIVSLYGLNPNISVFFD